MVDGPLVRLLDMVRSDLGAEDARIELGGADPTDTRLVWCALPEGGRLVAVLGEPPLEREACRERLVAWAESFEATLTSVTQGAAHPRTPVESAARRLHEELDAVVENAGAVAGCVVDVLSPEVWARSEQSGSTGEVDALLERAIEEVRREDRGPRARHSVNDREWGFVARGFAGIYRVVLVFAGSFSELRAEATLGRSLGRLERLVLALPPAGPPRGGARVRRLALVPPQE